MVPTGAADARYRAVLRDRQFGPLFLAHLLSLLGDRLAVVAVTVLVYQRTSSPLMAAAAYATSFLPWLLGAPVLAALTDRWPRRQVMLACDVARALLLLPLALPGVPLPVLLLSVTAVAWLGPVFDAARAGVLPEVLPHEDRYVAGSALTMLSNQSSQVLGLAAGGAVLTVVGARTALLLDSASFLLSAVLVLLFLRAGRTAVLGSTDRPPVLRQVVTGAGEVLRDPVLRGVLLLAWTVAAVSVVPEGLAVVVAERDGAPAWAVGLLLAAVPAGAAVGAVVLGRTPAAQRQRWMLPLGLLTAVALLVSALPMPWPAVAGVWSLVGVGAAVQLPASATFMLRVPDALRARGYGLAQTGLMAGQGVALLIAGGWAQLAGASVALAGVAAAGLGCVLLLAPRWPLRSGSRRGGRWVSPVDAWIAAVVLTAVVAGVLVHLLPGGRAAPWQPPAWLLAVLFFATGSYVATIRVGRQAHVLQLDAVPRLIGLFFATPAQLLDARLVGVVLALVLVRRQRGRKLLFNTGSFAIESCVAIAVFRALDPGGIGPQTWLAAFSATLAADLVSAWIVGVVIGLAEGRFSVRQVLTLDRLAVGTALAASTVGIISVTTLWHSPSSLVLLAVLVGLAALGQRAFTRLEADRVEQQRLQDLLRALGSLEPGQDSTARALEAVRDLLEVEAVSWSDGRSGGWAVQRAPDSEVLLDEDLLDALRRRCSRATARAGTALRVAVEPPPRPRTLWQWRTDSPEHAAVLLPASDAAAGESSARVLVASHPLHGSRADRRFQQLVQTVAEMLDQAVVRVEQRARLLLAARQDQLTGLPSLPEFRRQARALLQDARPVGVLVLNLKRLRAVNDVFGRDVGDRVIAAAAQRVRELTPTAVLGRVSGHHLACALPDLTAGAAVRHGRHLRTALELPLPAGDVETEIGVHVGVCLSPEHGMDIDLLLRRAETAGHAAEDEPFGVALFHPDREQDVARPLRLVSDLRAALAAPDQLRLVYQPQLDLKSGRVVSCEALLRWEHPELGPLPPDEFIGLAEGTGLITELTAWTLDVALRQSAQWERHGLPARVAVNLSPRNLLDDGLVARVAASLDRHGVPASRLVLEITETSVMAQPLRSRLLLDALRDLGVGLSVDDFGTGYSNLTYLRELPVQEVKLDRTFVQAPADDIGAEGRSERLRVFLQHAVGLVHALGLHVVVEGIEDEGTLEILRRLGADSAQGFFICRPLEASACTAWLRDQADTLFASQAL